MFQIHMARRASDIGLEMERQTGKVSRGRDCRAKLRQQNLYHKAPLPTTNTRLRGQTPVYQKYICLATFCVRATKPPTAFVLVDARGAGGHRGAGGRRGAGGCPCPVLSCPVPPGGQPNPTRRGLKHCSSAHIIIIVVLIITLIQNRERQLNVNCG